MLYAVLVHPYQSKESRDYPPTRNRSKWFRIVFAEKLAEARSMGIRRTYEARRGYSTGKPQTD